MRHVIKVLKKDKIYLNLIVFIWGSVNLVVEVRSQTVVF